MNRQGHPLQYVKMIEKTTSFLHMLRSKDWVYLILTKRLHFNVICDKIC